MYLWPIIHIPFTSSASEKSGPLDYRRGGAEQSPARADGLIRSQGCPL
jgi:hypothetical protein